MNNMSKFKTIEDAVRIGGKGSMRRKHKRVHASAPVESKRLQATLNKLSLYQMTGIDQLTLSMDDQSELVIHMPKVQGSSASNLLVVTGKATHVPAPAKREPEPPSPCPSPPPPPPPPPPPSPSSSSSSPSSSSPSSQSSSASNSKPAKKPKKPRNRVRFRNKRVQEMLLADAGVDASEDSDLGSADDLLYSPRYMKNSDGYDSDDSDKTKVPSDSSETDQTIVGEDSLLDFYMDDIEELGSGSDENLAEKFGSEENGDRIKEIEDDFEEYDSENEELQMTLDDLMSWLEEN